MRWRRLGGRTYAAETPGGVLVRHELWVELESVVMGFPSVRHCCGEMVHLAGCRLRDSTMAEDRVVLERDDTP